MSLTQTPDARDTARFRATAGTMQGFGLTPQDALAALMPRLDADASLPIVIWPYNRGDAFWSDAQQGRLQELKGRLNGLSAAERAELEALVAASFAAAAARARSLPTVKS